MVMSINMSRNVVLIVELSTPLSQEIPERWISSFPVDDGFGRSIADLVTDFPRNLAVKFLLVSAYIHSELTNG